MMFARHVCEIHGVCLRAIGGGEALKVWAHVTKLSEASVRCSSVIVNKGGNTSNIMKHLLTKHNVYLKQCTVFTMSPGSSSNCSLRDTFTSNVDSAVELHSRNTALIRNRKSTLFVCALKPCRLNISFACCSDMRLFRARTSEACVHGRSNRT